MKKLLIVGFALAGMAATTSLEAQVIARNPVNARADASGSWQVVGRDGNGSIYQRSTRDRNGNIVVQRARRDSNGNMRVISTQTVRDDDRRRNCDYNRSTNSIGDIIFGRSNDRVCDDEYSREDGGWYQVGRGRDNNSIYERRTRDSNGNLIIQRARRNSNGTMTIISTRRASSNDKQWKREQKEHRKDHKEWEKEHKKDHKEWKKEHQEWHKDAKHSGRDGRSDDDSRRNRR